MAGVDFSDGDWGAARAEGFAAGRLAGIEEAAELLHGQGYFVPAAMLRALAQPAPPPAATPEKPTGWHCKHFPHLPASRECGACAIESMLAPKPATEPTTICDLIPGSVDILAASGLPKGWGVSNAIGRVVPIPPTPTLNVLHLPGGIEEGTVEGDAKKIAGHLAAVGFPQIQVNVLRDGEVVASFGGASEPAAERMIVGRRVVSAPGAAVTETVLELSDAAKEALCIRGVIPPVRKAVCETCGAALNAAGECLNLGLPR
jgi:hypothetical protein